MRYNLVGKWVKVPAPAGFPAGATFLHPSFHMAGVESIGGYHGQALEGGVCTALIECDPSLVPAIEATGTQVTAE